MSRPLISAVWNFFVVCMGDDAVEHKNWTNSQLQTDFSSVICSINACKKACSSTLKNLVVKTAVTVTVTVPVTALSIYQRLYR